jgi:hypothetical protein
VDRYLSRLATERNVKTYGIFYVLLTSRRPIMGVLNLNVRPACADPSSADVEAVRDIHEV